MKTSEVRNKGIQQDARVQRRKEAEERQKEWESKTPEQQLADLDERLGKGVGAVKQRKRIATTKTVVRKPKSKSEARRVKHQKKRKTQDSNTTRRQSRSR